ncbi:thymidylate synthase [Candidatus Saccharibacteria bacterium]|nr:MAG: thymidylate synthase [Candidatus Saccharibacteria bacterium]
MTKHSYETQYLDLLRNIRDNGDDTTDRTGVGTRGIMGAQMRYDLRDGFPLLQTKRVPLGVVATELCWMLQGRRDLRYLVERNCNIWNEWPYVNYMRATSQALPPQDSDEWKGSMADYIERVKTDDEFSEEFGDLGPVYGYQWRHWPDGSFNGIDQLGSVQEQIKRGSDSRRLIVSAWNPADIEEMAVAGLPPCHMMYQFKRWPDGSLDMGLYQRSADMFLGVPFNMAQYALLLTMMAEVTGTTPRYFTHSFGDAHIYTNHFDQVEEQLSREPLLATRLLSGAPRIELSPYADAKDVADFEPSDVTVDKYFPMKAIKAPVAI